MEAGAIQRREALRRCGMKLLRSNGRTLQIFDIGAPVFELTAQRYPLRLHGSFDVSAGDNCP